jgi:hypothetical protein
MLCLSTFSKLNSSKAQCPVRAREVLYGPLNGITAYCHAAVRHVSSEVSLDSGVVISSSGSSSVFPAKVAPGVTCIVRRQMLFPYRGLRPLQRDLLPWQIWGDCLPMYLEDPVKWNDGGVRI